MTDTRRITVKPLEWSQARIYGKHFRDTARDMDGVLRYEVGVVPGKHYCCIRLPKGGGFKSIPCASVEEAKAVAQADHERRILSALTPAPVDIAPRDDLSCRDIEEITGVSKATVSRFLNSGHDIQLSTARKLLPVLSACPCCNDTPAPEAGWRQGIKQAAELAENFTSANHVAQDIKDGIFPEQSPIREAMARAIRGIEAPSAQPVTEQPVYETCSKCSGSGQMIGDAGEPTLCSECKGDTVVASEQPSVKEAARVLKQMAPALIACHDALVDGEYEKAWYQFRQTMMKPFSSDPCDVFEEAQAAALRSLAGDE
ncbi:MAG: hypothetical protein ACPG4X_15475 [Pikeienuella sp.]